MAGKDATDGAGTAPQTAEVVREGPGWLSVSRLARQSILIFTPTGEVVRIKVRDATQVYVQAPRSVRVLREELVGSGRGADR